MKSTKVRLSSNSPFFLDKHDHFWVVASHPVDIYYVKRSVKGKLKSVRNFLYTAEKGDILFSLNSNSDFEKFSLIAVSAKSKLIEINKSSIRNLSSKQLILKINRWLSACSNSLLKDNKPRIYTDISGLSGIKLKPHEVIYPSKGILWGNLITGQPTIYGEIQHQITTSEAKRILIPITKECWVQSQSSETEIELLETSDIVNDEISLMLSIHNIQKIFLQRIKDTYQSKINAEGKNIYAKATVDSEAINESMIGLKSIIQPKQDQQIFSNINRKNRLLATCQLIGSIAGFEFLEPKFICDYAQNITGQLEAISQVSNVRTRKVILRGTWWEEENGNLLAFTKENKEPVALIQNASGSYLIKNVADKTSQKMTGEMTQTLDPIAYMFLYAFDKPMTSVMKLWHFAIRGLRFDASYIVIAALTGSLLGLLIPILSGVLFDDVIPQADRKFLYEVVGIMLIVGLVSTLLLLTKGILLLRVETKSNVTIQAGLMDHLLRLPVTFYRKYAAGDLTLRVLGINAIRQILSSTVLTAVLSGTFSIVNLCLLFYYDSSLAWVGLALSFAAIIVIITLGFLKLKYDRQISDHQGEIQGFLFEFLSGISKIRVSGSEKRIFALWANKFRDFKTLGFRSGNYQNFVEAFNGSYPLLTNIFFFSFIYYALIHSTEQQNNLITVGAFIAFISAFNQFLNDCLNMSFALISSLNMVPLYERLKPILEEEPESKGESGDPGELSGEIEFNSVSFRYQEDQPLVLKNISFKIRQGEMVAFVGPSGSGKSTVLRLLLGFEDPEVGSVYYDGIAYESLNKDLVRRQIGVVLQNGSLMAGSIFKNIVGNSELTLEDAESAAKMAGLEEDIKQMPMGMHTVISEGASTFSGGQRQRLMIARSIVHKPRMLFMDEATSALDNRTQNIVSESLHSLQATRIVIAHRLSTVIDADRIYVMDEGEIVESGTYEQLIQKGALFSSLAQRQMA